MSLERAIKLTEQQKQQIEQELDHAIGMLRQWLNERPETTVLTSEQLKAFLNLPSLKE